MRRIGARAAVLALASTLLLGGCADGRSTDAASPPASAPAATAPATAGPDDPAVIDRELAGIESDLDGIEMPGDEPFAEAESGLE